MTSTPLWFVFDPVGEDLAGAKRCEAQVFLEAYGNTTEEFDLEYGPYEESTGFMTVLEDDGDAVATVRFIAFRPARLKTLKNVSRRSWQVDGANLNRGIEQCATIVDPQYWTTENP